MKKLLILILSIACSSQICLGQDKVMPELPRNEFSLSYGTISLMDIFVVIGNAFANEECFFPVHMEGQYLRNINKHIGLGFMTDYEYAFTKKYEMVKEYDSEGNVISKHKGDYTGIDDKYTFATFNAVARIYWFNREHFGMYSRAGVGAMALYDRDEDDPDNKVNWAFMPNLTPVGIEAGSRTVRGYVELANIWCLSFFNFGIKYSF